MCLWGEVGAGWVLSFAEIQNRQSLEIMLAREEEVKRRAIIHKEEYSGPLIRFYSKDGKPLGNPSCIPFREHCAR